MIQRIATICILALLCLDVVLVIAMFTPLPVQTIEQCGDIDPTDVAHHVNSHFVVQCFQAAFNRCRSASFKYFEDGNAVHIFTVERHIIGCNILDRVEKTNALLTGSVTYTCSGTEEWSGFYIVQGCGNDGDGGDVWMNWVPLSP